MNDRFDIPRHRRRWAPAIVDRALSIAVVEGDDQDTVRTKRLITGALWVTLLAPWPQMAQMVDADAPLAAAVIALSFVTAVLVLLIFWIRPSMFTGIFHVVIASNLGIAAAMTLLFGGSWLRE